MANTKTTRTFILVDGVKTLLTNAVMMEFAIEALREVDALPEVIAKAEQHYKSITKKSDAPKQLSAAAKENATYAAEAVRVMPSDDWVTTSWLMEHVRVNGIGIVKVNKMAQVMKLLVDSGRVVKDTSGRKVQYKLA